MQEQDTRQQATPAAITEDGTVSGGGLRYVMSGSWRNSNLSAVLPDLDKIEKSRPAGPVEIELSSVESIDTTGAWIIQRLRKDLEANGATVTLSGNDRIEQVIGQLPDKAEMEAEPVAREDWWSASFLRSARPWSRMARISWRACIFWVRQCAVRR